MKATVRCVCAVLLVLLFMTSVHAQTDIEQHLENSGAVDLWEQMDAQTRDMFEAVGVNTLSDLMYTGIDATGLLQIAEDMLAQQGRAPFAAMGMLLAAIAVCAYVGGLKTSLGDTDINSVYQTVCALAVCTVSLVPFIGCIRAVNEALSGVSVFMGSFVPVYVAVLAAGGNLGAAFSYQSILLLVSQGLGFLTGGVLLPLLTAALAMGIITAVTDSNNIGKIGEMLLRLVTWTLGTVSALFTAVLTVNGMLSAAGDGLGSRIAKFSIASMVPVVGGALSEAFLTVKGCIGVVRTTVGAFGIFSSLLLLLPTVIRCVCWQLCLWVCVTAAEVFGVKGVCDVLKTMQKVCKNMIALLAISGLFMTIATVVVARGTV